ncbi:MAG TPA: type I restriction endonuclease subunit M [Bdellovibrionales bacterium]|nr:MAG: type I restriction endonuclease subunit M [Bdellovibrionales bacterium GWB1_52_6]OFZ02433.1 MAG: type I restriction endonuclease subunit M [Bdellovibrionales bacterium GWA1_52_35]OFZ39320.1 MAG: type I restriction endonuclease subunit M [Bdellovibrionales bacterium GWC1_52_8]HAR41273.1 type I restriction endonuclease subunit M [Bdellovibrionales bacterium]HCM41539.1 type I restriction endonuclease subunit M [Bdellovibrionales bacterium]
MALKKSDLYSSLWESCNRLRGGMDATLYKDYVLFMLFVKYITDKYGESKDFTPPITIPKGASFKDIIAMKGKPDIGDRINKEVIAPLVDKNSRLARSDFPDFNDPNKLGEGKEMVDRLTDLIAIFEKPELDFSHNRAEHDDILGDAYEFLMRHFATESGKSKGQFYTPAEVSRILAHVIGISPDKAKASTTAYDPTCGSGSLLLKVAAQAGKRITLEGQEKDVTTAGLARMNMILHDFPTATILSGNTLTQPKFKDGEQLRTYDYVVANPPFSDKAWSTGLTSPDPYQRFSWGEPPTKQGDYAYLLHIIRSMKSTAKGACILPHGVLFRGNAEAVIRKQLVLSGILKGVIGLPANLFYGTGIPACILVLDKENASARKGVFMIDASKGFIKDGNKNRLREQDIHRIVDTFTKLTDVPRYARMVPQAEIANPKSDFNLNLPRYIDSSDPEDIHDIDGHLRGGIPNRDLDALGAFWDVLPGARAALFESSGRPGYSRLKLPITEVKAAILGHTEFTAFQKTAIQLFADWRKKTTPLLTSFKKEGHPKELIREISEDLLTTFRRTPLIDGYDIFQHLMDYWSATMQDDAYLIAADGWIAKPTRIVEKNEKTGKTKDKGWVCDLVPKSLIVARYFAKEQAVLDAKSAELEAATAGLAELEEEHGDEEGFLGALEKIGKGEIAARVKEIKNDREAKDEVAVLNHWLELAEQESALKRTIKELEATLDTAAHDHYTKLNEADIKSLVVDDKWMARLDAEVQGELDRVSQRLTGRIRELAERYSMPLPKLIEEVDALAARVVGHLKAMGAQ